MRTQARIIWIGLELRGWVHGARVQCMGLGSSAGTQACSVRMERMHRTLSCFT